MIYSDAHPLLLTRIMPMMFHFLCLFALVAAASPVDWVYITEYTTVYPTPTLYTVQGIGSLKSTPVSQNGACTVHSHKSHGNSSISLSLPTSFISSPSIVNSSSIWIRYGSGLPGSATPSPDFKAISTSSFSLQNSQVIISTTVLNRSSLARSFVWPKPTSLSPSAAPSPTSILAPRASSSIVYSRSMSAVTSSARIPVAASASQRTMSIQVLSPTSSMPGSSTAVVIVPITLIQPLAMDNMLARASRLPIIFARAHDEARADRREDATLETEPADGDEYSTTTSTTTLETTIMTDKLPTSRTSRKSSKSTRTTAKVSKTSMSSAASRTPSSVSSPASNLSDAVLVLPTPGRCLYPYPKQSCRDAMKTLATSTKVDQSATTKEKTRPEASKWCPYPGQDC
ncbi:hypothetical protein BDU57DRAFT_5615 [Ampelomyces quisqualis]|uniref:Uncharacterized protein n=1 Tax=Ampelomyces quisqualis TaxID=50730 RepID=A0A6A5QZT7_AMPQU|nr:hypothetical protein BDU57DRAFT_5615 [Ampelomyces quisqualis]